MKIRVVSVGKLKERYWAEAQAEYVKRLTPWARIDIVEVPGCDPVRAGGQKAATLRESKDVLAAIPEGMHAVLLDIGGREMTSEGIAARLDELNLGGTSSFCFIVGGSAGVDACVKDRSDESWSFGRITLPHNLARIVLLEQLYRASRISRGEPYHK